METQGSVLPKVVLQSTIVFVRYYQMMTTIRAALLFFAVLALTNTPVLAQSQTPDGHPDLGGVWDFRTVTPLERPSEFADKEFLTEEEAAAYAEARVIAQMPT